MRLTLRLSLTCLLFAFMSLSFAKTEHSAWFKYDENNQLKLQVKLFLSSTCVHCQKADAFFRKLEANKPWLEVQRYLVNQDKSALKEFYLLLQQQQSDNFTVPTVFFCNSRWVGFDNEESTGAGLIKGLSYCYENISKTGNLNANISQTLNQWAIKNWFQSNFKLPSPAFIPLIAVLDNLNSCSLFSILTLVAFLLLFKTGGLQYAIALLYLVVVGITHFIQQVNPLIFIDYYLVFRIISVLGGLGLLALLFNFIKIDYKWPWPYHETTVKDRVNWIDSWLKDHASIYNYYAD